MSMIDIHSVIVVYGDSEAGTTNPQRRYVDWTRHLSGVSVSQPTVREYVAQPGELLSVFSGSRTISVDGTTAFSLALNAMKPSVYRMTATGGTAPGFRTTRAGAGAAGNTVTVAVNNNATATFTLSGSTFSGIQVGDQLYVPSATAGDGAGLNPFNPNNAGFWVVLSVSSTVLTCKRRVGEDFSGAAEVVTLVGALQVFSSSGVQVGDNLEINSGFNTLTQRSFVVSEVTDVWVEFVSTDALPLETGITPGATGITFYSDCKRFLRVEVDQEAVLRLNGDTGNTNRVSIESTLGIGWAEKWGPVWDLKILNRSATSPMTVTVISVE
jgi:hypothetical protein